MEDLEERVAAIEARNKQVETAKKWETSWTRRLTVGGMTYVIAVSYLYLIDNSNPWLNALVPAGGYLLSTLVMKRVRKIWE